MSPQLPIIDLSAFLPSTGFPSDDARAAAQRATADELFAACHDVGFFYLKNHGVPLSLCDEVLAATKTWFTTASDADKAAVKRFDPGAGPGGSGDGARGYQKIGENVTQGQSDWHEAIDLYRPVPETTPPYPPLHGPNLLPPSLAPLIDTYTSHLLPLGQTLMCALSLALTTHLPTFPSPRTDLFTPSLSAPFWVMRLIGYPPLPASSPGVSCGEHSDYGCLTFLLTDGTTGALQVRDKAGAWLAADPIPGCYVVNIGDMVETWTAGLWRSTRHRVVHKGSGYRCSVPFFYEPGWDAWIKPFEECVKYTGGETKYKPVLYSEHLLGKVLGNFYGGGKDLEEEEGQTAAALGDEKGGEQVVQVAEVAN